MGNANSDNGSFGTSAGGNKPAVAPNYHNWDDLSSGERGSYSSTAGQLVRASDGTYMTSSGNFGVDSQRMSEAQQTRQVMQVRNQVANAESFERKYGQPQAMPAPSKPGN